MRPILPVWQIIPCQAPSLPRLLSHLAIVEELGKRAILGPLVSLAICDPRIARSAFFRINAAVAWRSRLPFGEPKGLTNGLTR